MDTQPNKVLLLPVSKQEIDITPSEPVEKPKKRSTSQKALSDAPNFDWRILPLVARGRPWKEISDTVGRSVQYIKKIVALPGFQAALGEYRQDCATTMIQSDVQGVVSAQALRNKALGKLDGELDSEFVQARIASAKVILEEAQREKAAMEIKAPITLAEVRQMSREDAKQAIQNLQLRTK